MSHFKPTAAHGLQAELIRDCRLPPQTCAHRWAAHRRKTHNRWLCHGLHARTLSFKTANQSTGCKLHNRKGRLLHENLKGFLRSLGSSDSVIGKPFCSDAAAAATVGSAVGVATAVDTCGGCSCSGSVDVMRFGTNRQMARCKTHQQTVN